MIKLDAWFGATNLGPGGSHGYRRGLLLLHDDNLADQQEQLAKEYVGTIDSSTGLLLSGIDSRDRLIYTQRPPINSHQLDRNGDLLPRH